MVLANRHAVVVRGAPGHAVVDGQFGYGRSLAVEAMDLRDRQGAAIGLLRDGDPQCRAPRAHRRVGRAGRASRARASIHFVNTSGFGILVAPHGGTDRRLSANPIAAGAPGPDGAPLVLDMSTSAIAEGKIQVAEESRRVDCRRDARSTAQGSPNRDPAIVLRSAAGRAVAGRRPQRLRAVDLLRDPRRRADRRADHESGQSRPHGRLVNNMLTVDLRPRRVLGAAAFRAEIARLAAWVEASPPRRRPAAKSAAGEIERRTRAQLERDGIPLDAVTHRQIADSVRSSRSRCPQDFTRVEPPVACSTRCAALRARGTAFGCHGVRILHARPLPVLAAAGAEFVLLDMEHSGVGHRDHEGANRVRATAPASCRWSAFRRALIT